jgi:hypothetical protein
VRQPFGGDRDARQDRHHPALDRGQQLVLADLLDHQHDRRADLGGCPAQRGHHVGAEPLGSHHQDVRVGALRGTEDGEVTTERQQRGQTSLAERVHRVHRDPDLFHGCSLPRPTTTCRRVEQVSETVLQRIFRDSSRGLEGG